MIRNNRTAMNAYKKTREKHGGARPCCVVCGEAMDPEDDETECPEQREGQIVLYIDIA